MDVADFRLGRFFHRDTGRALVIAFDSGLITDVSSGGDRVGTVVQAAVDAGVEGILLSPGLLDRSRDRLAHRNAPGVLVRGDLYLAGRAFPSAAGGTGEAHRTLVTPAEAVALGADGIVMFLVLGSADDAVTADNARAVARAAREAHAVGIPLIVETVLWGSRIENPYDAEALTYLNRMAAELGADAVKTQFTGDTESMRGVVANCPVPVLLLGGPKAASTKRLLADVTAALAAGVCGLVYGRNVWQAADPRAAAKRLHGAVHRAPPPPDR